MPHCPQCGSHRLRKRHSLFGAATYALTGLRRFGCAKCGWKGWKRRHDGSGTPAGETASRTAGRTAGRTAARTAATTAATTAPAAQQTSDPPSEPATAAPNTFYRSRRYGSGPRGRAGHGNARQRRWTGRKEKPADVLKAVLIVLVALAVIWGAAQACSLLRPPQDDASQQ